MPKTFEARKGEDSSARSRSLTPVDEDLQEQAGEESQAPDKAALIARLKAQGAVRVFPGMGAGGGAGTEAPTSEEAPRAEKASEEAPTSEETPRAEEASEEAPEQAAAVSAAEAPAAASEDEQSAPEAQPAKEAIDSQSQGTGEIDPAFHERVQRMTDAANHPKWNDFSQRIENARYGKWDLTQSRERSGNRKRDVHLEEDVRTHQVLRQMQPGTFDVRQKAKNAVKDVVQNPGRTAVGMIPLVGGLLKQKMAEKYDVKERDLLRGISSTTTNEALKTSAASQAHAVGATIKAGRVKAGIGMVTGLVGDLVPGGSIVKSAVGAATDFVGDQVVSGERSQMVEARAREQARKMMKKKEFAAGGIDKFLELEDKRRALQAAGRGKAGGSAPVVDSEDELRELLAHTRGETEHYKYYKKRAKEVLKERAEAAKPKTEEGGLMSRVKRFFGRS
ncbi:hypothetical protein [Cohnella hongkongensis]|uniref:Uncharacterized protein n=1 Tax=Cohnella hongkongensis TaxID=178337 RepID=A0ABV9FC17_9BACL